jgi:hypothetical protein
MGAALHDSQAVDHLLTRNNTGAGVWADAAYRSEEMKAKLKARKLTSHIHRKGKRGKPLTEQAKGSNRTKSSVRVRVEHLFGAQVPIASLGGFNLQLPYAFALLLGALLCLFPGQFAIGLKHLPSALTPRLVTYVVYLLILHFSFAGGQSQGIVLRQVFFLTCGCIFALGIVATGANPRVLRVGGFLAIVGFLAVVEVLAWQIGLSWTIVIQHFVSTGDLEFVFYDFLKETFQLVASSDHEAKASEKNIVAVAILTGLFLFRAGHRDGGADRFGQLITLLALATLVILNTRSVLLIAAISLPLAGWIGAMRNGLRSSGEVILKSMLFFGIMIAAVLVLTTDSAAVSLIEKRFSFSDDSSGNRVLQYSWALERIEANPIWGSGLAEFKGQLIHNLFLGAWMHAGLVAFLLVIFTYLMVVVGWFVFLVRVLTQPGYWVLPARAEWIAILPILPIFRVWITGDAGHPSFAEWITLCAFFGMILTNCLAKGASMNSAAMGSRKTALFAPYWPPLRSSPHR